MRMSIAGAVALSLTAPVAAQDTGKMTTLDVNKDRTGKRFADRYQLRCTSAGQIWAAPGIRQRVRKTFVQAGASALEIGTAAPPGSIGDAVNGSLITYSTTLAPGQNHDFGNPQALVIRCDGPGDVYVHIEWNRKTGPLDFGVMTF